MSNKIDIKRGMATVATVSPLLSSNAVLEEQVTLSWEGNTRVDLKLNDYIVFDGTKYTLNALPTVKKNSTKNWRHDAIFQAPIFDLLKVSYLFPAIGNDARGDFPLTGTPDVFMNLLIDNLNRVYPGVWSLGSIVSGEAKTITFGEDDNCLSVAQKLADEYKTELSLTGYAINLNKVTRESGLTLRYGSTLYDVERRAIEQNSVVTRLRPFGSTRNLPADYRGGSPRLLLPEPLQYVERGVAEYGIIEGKKNFDDIYPRLASGGAGTITGVADIFTFVDSALDFDINEHLLPGTPAKVKFLTGQCSGYECEIQKYTHAEKKIVVIANKDDKGFEVPNEAVKPAVGDKYVLLDINMPLSYRTAAENELKAAAEKWLEENPPTKCEYTVTFSDLYARANSVDIRKNDMIPFVDADFGINEPLRVQKVTKGVADPWNVKIDISNTVSKTTWENLINDVESNEQAIVELQGGLQQSFARNWRQVEELSKMIETLHAEMLVVGNVQGQFTLAGVLFSANYSQNANQFYATAGTLHHTMVPSAENPKSWSMAAYNNSSLSAGTAYYLYARCGKNTTNGTFLLSATAREWDADSTYYYFLIGVLSSVYDGARTLQTTYGFTQIAGNQITTGRIQSKTGKCFFDLDVEVISGNIQFLNNGTETDLGTWANETENSITSAQLLVLSSTSQVMPCNYNNVPLPGQTITFTAKLQHLTGVASFTATAHTSNGTHTLQLGGTGNTRTLTSQQWATTYIKVVVTANLGGQSDTVTIYRNNEGAVGAVGQGIDTITEQFYLSTSKTQLLGGSWQDTPPAWENGKYMWTRAKIVYKNPYAETYTEAVCDSTWEIVNGIEAGAENLLLKTDYKKTLDGITPLNGGTKTVDIYGRATINSTLPQVSIFQFSNIITLEANRTYLFHADFWWGKPASVGFNTNILGSGAMYSMAEFKEVALSLESGVRVFYKITPTQKLQGRVQVQAKANANDLRVMRPMLECATVPSDYSPAYQDTDEAINAAMEQANTANALALKANAVTDKFGTVINGGLIATVMILLRELNSTLETAGISGQQGDGYEPSYFSGGTLAEAVAFGALMRAIDGGTVTTNHWQAKQAQIVMLHNGHAKIGGVIVNNRGELVMMQNSVNESFVIRNNALTPFVQATGGTSQAGVANNTMQTVYSGTPVQLPNTLNVTQSGSTIRFTALLRAQHEQGINTTTIIGASIRAELYRGNVFYAMLGMVGVANGTSERNIDMQIRNVEQGVYNVRVTYEKDPTSQGFGHIGASELSYNFTAGSIKRTELANNGFMSVMRDGHIYFAERLGLDLKGATNMPGVLLSASVLLAGGFAHSWGAKKHPAQAAIKNSVGRYTVYHDIGHTSYHVNATPSSANKSCHIVGKYSTYFIIEWRTIGSVSSLADTAFDFQITGDNYTPSVVKDESGRT